MHRFTVWQCPDCGRGVEQTTFGTQHTSGLACIDCETDMEQITLEESKYEYDEELIENDGRVELERAVEE